MLVGNAVFATLHPSRTMCRQMQSYPWFDNVPAGLSSLPLLHREQNWVQQKGLHCQPYEQPCRMPSLLEKRRFTYIHHRSLLYRRAKQHHSHFVICKKLSRSCGLSTFFPCPIESRAKMEMHSQCFVSWRAQEHKHFIHDPNPEPNVLHAPPHCKYAQNSPATFQLLRRTFSLKPAPTLSIYQCENSGLKFVVSHSSPRYPVR